MIWSKHGNIFIGSGHRHEKIGTVAEEEIIKLFVDFLEYICLSHKAIPDKNNGAAPNMLNVLQYSIILFSSKTYRISWSDAPLSQSLDYFVKRLLEETISAISNISQQRKEFRPDKAQFDDTKDYIQWYARP